MLLNKEAYTFLQKRLYIYTGLNLLVVVLVYILLGAESKWLASRNEAVAIPEFKHTYPFISYMPVMNKEINDASLYTFVEQYIRLTYSNETVDYHKPTNMSRYRGRAYLKTNLLKSVQMSRGVAKEENLNSYKNSDQTFQLMENCNCNWVFNIYAIESIRKTNFHDTIFVTILGEFQQTFDGAKSQLPHSLWGFKRIYLSIIQGRPEESVSGEPTNDYGLYVIAQETEDINYLERDRLLKQIYNNGYFVP